MTPISISELFAKFLQRVAGRRLAFLGDDEGDKHLVELWVRHADHIRAAHARVTHEGLFHLDGGDVDAAAFHHFFKAAPVINAACGVQRA